MDKSDRSGWGGYRPGAGQKPKWNSGSTITIRVPEKLASEIMLYAQLIDGQSPSGLQIEECLTCKLDSVAQSSIESDTKSSHVQALEVLRSALNLKANAGGAIKLKIKQAIDLLAKAVVA